MNTFFHLSNINDVFTGYFVDRNLNVYSNKRNSFIKLRPKRNKNSKRQYYALWHKNERYYIELSDFNSDVSSNPDFTEWQKQNAQVTTNKNTCEAQLDDSNIYICGSLEYEDFCFITIAVSEADARAVCEEAALANPGTTYVYSRLCGRVKTGALQWH